MQLTRLQELITVTEGKITQELTEARSTMTDFDGIQSIVNDALGDLSDKLGKNGSLATLMKSSGAAKLDTVKDSDGKNILAQIVAKTTEYKKSMEKLLMEAEMLLSQVNEGQSSVGSILAEGSTYADSADFTDEFFTLHEKVNSLEKVMKNPRWMAWMKTTDQNFGTECEGHAKDAKDALTALKNSLNQVGEQLDQAE